MKFKNFILKNMITIIVAFAIVFIGILINWVRGIGNVAVVESTLDEMEQIGLQYQILLINTLNETKRHLMHLADSIVDNDIDGETILDYFNSQYQIEEFDSLYYVELDGVGISSDNRHFDFSSNASFLNALNNDFHIEPPHVSLDSSDIVFDLAVPIIKNDEPIAVLFSEVSIEDFFNIIIDNKDYEGDIFFIDSNLNIIYSTSDNHIGTTTIPEEDFKAMGAENISTALKDFANKQSGGFFYDYYGTPKVMVYYPLESTDIALAMNVHVESISTEIIMATEYFGIIGSIIYWTIIVLVIYISFIQSRSNKRMLKVAYYDSLTELPNLTKLKAIMESTLTENKHKEYTLLVFDVENFKAINQIFGYEMGDNVLKAFKTVFDRLYEPSLISARIGDDKFAMFSKSSFLDDLESLISRVTQLFDDALPALKDYAGTFKLGRYKIEKGETNVDEIMSKVFLAHNKAKSTKGIPFCDYDEEFIKTLQKEAEITNTMYGALENKEFKAFLQPKFDIYGDKLVGAEALVRWIDSNGNMIFPNDFIPLFERNGFIVNLDKYILEEVCITLRRWLDEGLNVIPISVNCSRINLGNPYFVSGILETADKYSIPHEYIEIELTESTTIESELTIEQLFDDLHAHGFKISIDDFGAGHSSLGMLKNLHIDTLKMDRSFFVGGKNERRDDMLIDSNVRMSHNLGIYVVAEGIETAEQIELLRTMNCDAIQGYYFAKPMPISEFELKYRTNMTSGSSDYSELPIVKPINDVKYANSIVPAGIIVAKADEHFTMLEANDYYFDMIGYTREELRDIFHNYGTNIMTPQSRIEVLQYFNRHMQTDPYAPLEVTNRFVLKSGEEHVFRINGKLAVNENGEPRIYATIVDITDYFKEGNIFQKYYEKSDEPQQ